MSSMSLMKRNPRYGPQPGERVRVKSVFGGYPLRDGLKEGDIVLLKTWEGGWYRAEFEGREVAINSVNIVKPTLLTDGRMLCPECNQTLRGKLLECVPVARSAA